MRVVVVEDQVLFREFLTGFLRDRVGCDIAGVAEDGPAALEVVRATRPDLLVLDILIPKLSGIQVARALQAEMPALRILALSTETDPKTVHQLHQLQLAGFIDKNEATAEVLAEAIGQIRMGRRFFSPSMRRAVEQLMRDPKAFQKILTTREQEVLTHIGAGLSDGEIGRILGLSETSVQSHRRNLCRKLDVHSTPELIRFAQEAGFWKPAFRRMGLSSTYHVHD